MSDQPEPTLVSNEASPDPPHRSAEDGVSQTVNLRNSPSPATPSAGMHVNVWTPQETNSKLDGTLFGDYQLISEVGRGGMGVVYKARHRRLNRIVAVKVTQAGRLLTEEEERRFQAEAAACGKLDHPNIVPIFEIGKVYGQQFFSMAFVEGASLAHAVADHPLTSRRAAELLQPVAAAIAHAHAQGVIHRDLKPENILLDASGRPRITDFGIAKCTDQDSRLTQAGEVVGTPSYMPPEQAQGAVDQVGPAADVYSLGATLYCLLTGRPPFQAATPLETFKQVVETDPVMPRRLNPAVDRDLETICLKCLEKRPERRYPSAAALADDLQRFLEQRPIQARPVRFVEKALRWRRRNPLTAALLASVVALFLTAFALVSWSYYRAEEAFRNEAQQRTEADVARDEAIQLRITDRWERYRANMSNVASAFELKNVAIARRALYTAPEEHRNWEWRHHEQRLDASQKVWRSPSGPVNKFLFLGKHLLATMSDTLTLWDVAAGRILRTFDDFEPTSSPHLDVSPDGRLIAYCAKDSSVILWDLVKERRHLVLRGSTALTGSFGFSANGKRFISCARNGQAHVWDIDTGAVLEVITFAENSKGELGFGVTGQFILAGLLDGDSVQLWDSATGRKVGALAGHQRSLVAHAFRSQGRRIVTSESFPSKLMRLFDTDTFQQVAVLQGHNNSASPVRYSPDGARIASASFDRTIRLWDGLTGRSLATFAGHNGRVLEIAFSPDSKRLVSTSQDHTLMIWDLEAFKLVTMLCGHVREVLAAAYSPDGQSIVSGSEDGTIRWWDARLAERTGVLRGHESFAYDVAFHPDGRRVASASWDGTIRFWDATTGTESAVWRYDPKELISSLAFHPSGRWLATLARDNAVRLWDVDTGKPVHQFPLNTEYWKDSRLAFNRKGDMLAAGDSKGGVHVWNFASRKTEALLQGHSDTVQDVVFSPDGSWLASAGADLDKTIHIWDVANQKSLRVLRGHKNGILALAVSHDGQLLASGSDDGTVRLWDTATWTLVDALPHECAVFDIAFSHDKTRLVAACADTMIRFWDVATRQEITELRGHTDYVHAVAFSPQGTRLASASGDFTVRIWDTLPSWNRDEADRKEGNP